MKKRTFLKSNTLLAPQSNRLHLAKHKPKKQLKAIPTSKILYIKDFRYSEVKDIEASSVSMAIESTTQSMQQSQGVNTSLYQKYQKRHSHLLNEVIGKLKVKRNEGNGKGQSTLSPEEVIEKKNGLTLLPQTKGTNENSVITSMKTETVIRSAVSMRRMEYNEKLLQKPSQPKDPHKVITIQRHWRRYYLRELLKVVRVLQQKGRKFLKANGKNKKIVAYQRLCLSIRKRCYRKYFRPIFFRKKKRYIISNEVVNVYIKADTERITAEHSLKIMFNLDTNCNNINCRGMKIFPRHFTEISSKLVKRNRNIGMSIQRMEEMTLGMSNSNRDDVNMNISFISNCDIRHLPINRGIPKKIAYSQWNIISLKSYSLVNILFIQRSYKKHCSSRLIHRMKKSTVPIFANILFSYFKRKAIKLYSGRVLKLSSNLAEKKASSIEKPKQTIKPLNGSSVEKRNERTKEQNQNANRKHIISLNSIGKAKLTCCIEGPPSTETESSFAPMKSKEIIDESLLDESILIDDDE